MPVDQYDEAWYRAGMNKIPRWMLAIAALSLLLIAASIASRTYDDHQARNECVTYATGAQSHGCD